MGGESFVLKTMHVATIAAKAFARPLLTTQPPDQSYVTLEATTQGTSPRTPIGEKLDGANALAELTTTASDSEADLPPTITRAIHRIVTWRESLFETLTHHGLRHLLCEIVRCASWKKPESEIFVSNPTLCLRLGISSPTLKRGLKALVECGWIIREQMRSRQNKFIGTNTWLTKDAILSLGLHLKPQSLFFRGSDVSHTIGYLGIQSSSKRQDLISAVAEEQPNTEIANSINTAINVTTVLCTPPTPPVIHSASIDAPPIAIESIAATATATATATVTEQATQLASTATLCSPVVQSASNVADAKPFANTAEELLRCRAPNGQIISLPRVFEPLLQKLAAHQICRLMGDASRAGHRLEDIVLSCQKSILKAKHAMAYIRRLINHNRDWKWLRSEREGQALESLAEQRRTVEARQHRSAAQQFLSDYDNCYFANTDSSRIYHIAGGYCSVSYREQGVLRSGAVLVCEKLMAAINAKKLKSVDAYSAKTALA